MNGISWDSFDSKLYIRSLKMVVADRKTQFKNKQPRKCVTITKR